MMSLMTVVISAAEIVPSPLMSAAVHCLSSPGTAAHPAAGSPGHSTMIEMILVSDDALTTPSPLQSPGHTAAAGRATTAPVKSRIAPMRLRTVCHRFAMHTPRTVTRLGTHPTARHLRHAAFVSTRCVSPIDTSPQKSLSTQNRSMP